MFETSNKLHMGLNLKKWGLKSTTHCESTFHNGGGGGKKQKKRVKFLLLGVKKKRKVKNGGYTGRCLRDITTPP